MIRFTFIISFCMMLSVAVNAQAKLFNSGEKVVVQISSTYGKVYVHEMNAQQTVYSLAKSFDQRMQDIRAVNPGVNFDAMKIGQKIRVPFLAASMVKSPEDIIKGGEYVQVYYKIRPKDNLYRIAKVYFDTSIENLMEINRSQSIDLIADELIKVGWMPIGNTPKAKPATYEYTTVVKREETPATAEVSTVPNPASNPTPAAQKPEAVKQKVDTKEPIVQNSERASRREKPKKQGFFARVFGSKNKKKKRDEKEIKEVVNLSEQLEQKPNPTPAPSPTVEPNVNTVTTTPEVEKIEELSDQPKFETIVETPTENIDIEERPAPTYTYKSDKGIAIWNQTSTNSKNMFALHPTAKVGSYIEITNPMMNKTVQAKVIGNIPPRTYTDDVSIVVSPMVAKTLGVVDRRFAVRVKYREE